MTSYDYDLITIGAGSGGVRASRMAAATGARVAVIENMRTGGTCVMRGCVPKKLLVYGAHFAHDFEDSRVDKMQTLKKWATDNKTFKIHNKYTDFFGRNATCSPDSFFVRT